MLPAQLVTLKADIQGNPTLAALWAAGERGQVAAHYSQTASPAFYVWRSSISIAEVLDSLVVEDWTALDNLTVGQDRIWVNLKETGAIKPASEAHRAALTECWKGTAAKVAVRDRILALGKRTATYGEKLFAVGTGTQIDPATMTYENQISMTDCELAMAS